jgi:hypothetical protein
MHLLVAWCDVPLAYLPCLIREEAVVPPPFEAGITGTKVSARAEITEIEVTIREDEAARFGEAQLRMVLRHGVVNFLIRDHRELVLVDLSIVLAIVQHARLILLLLLLLRRRGSRTELPDLPQRCRCVHAPGHAWPFPLTPLSAAGEGGEGPGKEEREEGEEGNHGEEGGDEAGSGGSGGSGGGVCV